MFRRIFVSLTFFSLLAGCSSTNQAYYDTLKLAFSQTDLTVTSERLRQSQADLLAVKHGDRSQVILALAFIEDNTQTWVSADKALFTMQHGVITQTHGLDNDLVYHSELAANPLINSKINHNVWNYTVDIEGYGYGLDVTTQWTRGENETLSILDHDFSTYIVEQHVSYPGVTPYLEIGMSWINRYWIDVSSGEILKSEQKLSPVNDVMTMIFLSRAQRLIDAQGSVQ